MAKLIHETDIGDSVLCDHCDKEWRNRDESGGFQFTGKVYCPECADYMLKQIKSFNEEQYIKGYCPEDMSFWQWVLSLRGGNNTIKVWEL